MIKKKNEANIKNMPLETEVDQILKGNADSSATFRAMDHEVFGKKMRAEVAKKDISSFFFIRFWTVLLTIGASIFALVLAKNTKKGLKKGEDK